MPLIETRNLVKLYGPVRALDGLTISLEPGVIGLVGANGAGKSTFIKILLGLISPTQGEAFVLGMNSATQGPTLRRLLGYMPEHDCLPPDVSATEFVTHMARISGLPRAAARERTADVLRHCGLYEERYRHIGGYSTGMKQRVKLAQALVHDPRLLLLDEPTNGLDPAGRDDMLALIRRTGQEFGIAVVVASHLLGEIEQVCNYLVAIDAGHLLHAAPLETFTRRTGILALEVGRNADGVATRLTGEGLTVRRAAGEVVYVALQDERPFDMVRDAIAEMGVPLLRMEQLRGSLEDLFRAPEAPGLYPPYAAYPAGYPATVSPAMPYPGQPGYPGDANPLGVGPQRVDPQGVGPQGVDPQGADPQPAPGYPPSYPPVYPPQGAVPPQPDAGSSGPSPPGGASPQPPAATPAGEQR